MNCCIALELEFAIQHVKLFYVVNEWHLIRMHSTCKGTKTSIAVYCMYSIYNMIQVWYIHFPSSHHILFCPRIFLPYRLCHLYDDQPPAPSVSNAHRGWMVWGMAIGKASKALGWKMAWQAKIIMILLKSTDVVQIIQTNWIWCSKDWHFLGPKSTDTKTQSIKGQVQTFPQSKFMGFRLCILPARAVCRDTHFSYVYIRIS